MTTLLAIAGVIQMLSGAVKEVPCAEPRFIAYQSNRFLPFFSPNGHQRNSYSWNIWNTGETMHLFAESNSTIVATVPAIAGMDLNLLEAWRYQNNASTIKVALVDTGCNSHRDLQTLLPGVNFPLGASTPSPGQSDSSGHGTFEAGLIAGWPSVQNVSGPTNLSLLGVAPFAKILSARVELLGLPGLVGAFEWAVTSGARVINCSWGFPYPPPELYDACIFARDHGVIIVQAAPDQPERNVDTGPDWPGSFDLDNIVAVTSMTPEGIVNQAHGTNLVAAPGLSLVSIGRFQTNYVYGGGTSFAAPQVCGVLALLIAQNPTWTHQQVIARLRSTLDPCPTVQGRVNAGRALKPPNPAIRPAFQPLAMGGGGISAPEGPPVAVEMSRDLREWIPYGLLLGGETLVIDAREPYQFFRSRP